MDLRIGVIQAPRELVVEMADDIDRASLKAEIDAVLADDTKVLWLTDKRGREVAIPAAKLAYIEVGAPDGDRRIGFGS